MDLYPAGRSSRASSRILSSFALISEWSAIKKTYIDEITRQDIFRFHEALAKRGCGDRTIANKHARLKSWLIFAGIDRDIFPPKPRYEEGLPKVYASDEISTLLAEADPYVRTPGNAAYGRGLSFMSSYDNLFLVMAGSSIFTAGVESTTEVGSLRHLGGYRSQPTE